MTCHSGLDPESQCALRFKRFRSEALDQGGNALGL